MWHLKAEGVYNFLYYCFCFVLSFQFHQLKGISSSLTRLLVSSTAKSELLLINQTPDLETYSIRISPESSGSSLKLGNTCHTFIKAKQSFSKPKLIKKYLRSNVAPRKMKELTILFIRIYEQLGSYIIADPCDFNHRKIISVLLYKEQP